MRAYVYLRCSTDEQADSGHGLNAQRDACARWAAANGAELAGEHADEGVSGGAPLDKRPALMAALQGLGRGDVLVIAKRDRLARDPIISAMCEAAAARKGARIASAAGEGTADDSAAGLLMRRLVDCFAEYERSVIRQRVKAALAAKKQRGQRVGGIPLGKRAAPDGMLADDPDEQRVVARVLELKAEGLSFRKIAAVLDAEGFKARGARWHAMSVSRIVSAKAVAVAVPAAPATATATATATPAA